MLLAFSAPAEIYKWVDANGRTHFSERPDDAGRAKAVETTDAGKPPSSAGRSGDPAAQAQYWQERERQFRERRIEQQNAQKAKPAAASETKPKSLSGGRAGDTDASRCALARDVLSGAVRHGNGKPTDQYDRDVATSDVRAYCH